MSFFVALYFTIYHVKKAEISQKNELIHVRLTFRRGLEREFVYRVETES